MRLIATVLLFMLSIFVIPPIFAAEASLDTIVVTATKFEEPASESTQDITVIRSEDIEKKGAESLPELFRSYTDMSVAQTGGAGKQTSVFLRGAESNHILVMVDGVRIKNNASLVTDSFDFSWLNVGDIERIEIVKGPQSTLYGAEAMAGVINIITKKGSGKPKLTVSAEAGSFSTFNGSAGISGSNGMVDYRITGSYYDTDGISAYREGSEEDGYTNRAFSARLGLNPTERFSLDVNIRYTSADSELDDFGVDDLNSVQERRHFLKAVRASLYLTENYEQALLISKVDEDVKGIDPDPFEWNYTVRSSLETVDWQHNLYIRNASLAVGLEYKREKGDDEGNFKETIKNKAVYLNAKTKHLDSSLVLNAGLRYDDNEVSGNKTTYRVGALYDLKEMDMRLRVVHATGFKAPSLTDLFLSMPPWVFPNPNLKPEETKSYEFGLEKDLIRNKLSFNLTYFLQKYSDLLDFDFITSMMQNLDRVEINGLELGLNYNPIESVSIKASHTNLDIDEPLLRRPKNKFQASLEYSKNKATAGAEYLYVGTRKDIDTTYAPTDNASYSIVNIYGKYVINDNLALFAKVNNLFDEDYEEIKSYGTEGVSVFAGLKASF